MGPYDVTVTLRDASNPYVDPRPVLFTCKICERDVRKPQWHNQDGRSRPIAPFCQNCEQAYGGGNLSSFKGPRMDARIARSIKAGAVFLTCLAARTKQEGKRRGA
jgi:hypothetical protein